MPALSTSRWDHGAHNPVPEYRQNETIPQRCGKIGAVNDKSVNTPAHHDHGIEIPESQEKTDHVRVLWGFTIADFDGLDLCKSTWLPGMA